jgi:hypothetical protein
VLSDKCAGPAGENRGLVPSLQLGLFYPTYCQRSPLTCCYLSTRLISIIIQEHHDAQRHENSKISMCFGFLFPRLEFRQERDTYLQVITGPPMGPTQLPIQWILESLLGSKADAACSCPLIN